MLGGVAKCWDGGVAGKWKNNFDIEGAYLISLNIEVIILCSACRTAISRPFASHSHCARAGELQMAQSGSMILSGFLDLLRLINMISGRICGIDGSMRVKTSVRSS